MNAAQDKASMAIRETAIEWSARLAAPEVSHGDKVAFAAWLRTSPVHVREYLNAEALRFTVGSALEQDETDVRKLLDSPATNVVPLEARPQPASAVSRRPAARRAAIAASVAVLFAGGVALVSSGALRPNAYSTAVGEIRRVKLPDGSTLELNTRSSVRIDFADNRRDIHLKQGEAFFVVAKDPSRPFRVLSDTAEIRAIGTQFSVYRHSRQTVVTVLEGKVAAGKERRTVELTAGSQVVIASSANTVLPQMPAKVDAQRITSWRRHRLIFDNEPLSAVAAEFNRYNRQQLVIEDPELAAQGISGVFDPDKPQGLLLFLNKKGGVRAVEGPDSTLVLTR